MEQVPVKIYRKRFVLDLSTPQKRLWLLNRAASRLDEIMGKQTELSGEFCLREKFAPLLKASLKGEPLHPLIIKISMKHLEEHCFKETEEEMPKYWSEFWSAASWKAFHTLFCLSMSHNLSEQEGGGEAQKILRQGLIDHLPQLTQSLSVLDYACRHPKEMHWNIEGLLDPYDDFPNWRKQSPAFEVALIEDWQYRLKSV